MSGDPDALKAEALRVLELGRPRRARELLEEAHRAGPTRADVLYRLALARLDQEAVDEGVEALERALELDPERRLLTPEFLEPVEALLTRRPTFKNLVKLRRQLAEGKPLSLRPRSHRPPHPA